MSGEITDSSQATPYGIAVAGLLEIEDIGEGCPELAPAVAVAVRAREAASQVAADHRAAALLPQPADAEPEPAKVIVVTERDRLGRVARELRYDANQAEVSEYGILRVLRKGRVIGEHQGPGGFSWREEGAVACDGPADKRKLAIALEALKRLSEQDYNPDNPGEQTFEIAEDALVSIADVDL